MALDTSIECVLFDLDGSLIDTAQDFKVVLDRLTVENNRESVTTERIYQTVSDGARALVKLAFAIEEDHESFEGLNQRLLELYYEELAQTRAMLYPGLEELLADLDANNIPWGIVTNKPEKYTLRLLENMQLLHRCGALVCPDHVEHRKPHPEPILKACEALSANTERTVYVGDHLRDIQAAKNADVIAIAAAYGYLGPEAKAEEWYADFIVQEPTQIVGLLNTLKFA
ncbi:MAG: HAD-IA family hydrolase [Proteobacteria bacterium]|nr:HAD-IA family hydrolase [Pseudomonadota bacterium]MDA0926924.1 HAD-IA family hydrolase [Pseudomonadota bacterium]